MYILLLIHLVVIAAIIVTNDEYSQLYYNEPYGWPDHPEVLAIVIVPVINIIWLFGRLKDIKWAMEHK